jgi:hypothetical protein
LYFWHVSIIVLSEGSVAPSSMKYIEDLDIPSFSANIGFDSLFASLTFFIRSELDEDEGVIQVAPNHYCGKAERRT